MNVNRWLAAALAAFVSLSSRAAAAGERTPVVTGTREGARIALGAAHSCVIATDGTVRC